MVDRAKHAAWGALGFLVAAGLVIGFFTWMTNNTDRFTAVASSWGNAASTVAVTTGDWVTEKASGDAATADVSEAKVVWVENKAPARWPVRRAVATWNKGLTAVQLKVGKCQPGAGCIKVAEASYLAPNDGGVTLGKTTRLFGTSVRFNRDAVHRVPAAYLAVSTCHELGHALGLKHRAAKTTCMNATVGTGSVSRPDATDFASVNAKYGHR